MKLYDITRTLQDAPVYPGSEPVTVEKIAAISDAGFRESRITACSHMGTHADAEAHFIEESTVGIDKMPLERYYGPCVVVSVSPEVSGEIEPAELACAMGAERLVLHTGGARYLSAQSAKALLRAGLRTVVTDALSVASPEDERTVHELLLGAGAAIVENVVLSGISDGNYTLCAFPNKIGGCDGAPVRAVLIEE